jgi:hypothetical protein
VGYLPHVVTKLKRDENLAGLIWASKGSLQGTLEMFWIGKLDKIFIQKGA